MAELQTIDPDAVDRVLGAGVHAAWQQLHRQFLDERARSEENRRRYWEGWARPLVRPLVADLAFAGKAAEDYGAFLARASADGESDAGEGDRIRAVLALAVAVLGSVNDVLDDVFVLRIHALLTALAGAKLEVEAKWLTQRLLRLQEELEKARREGKETTAQPAIGAVIAGARDCSKPLRWLAGGAAGLAQMIADNYLGPADSDPVGSNPSTWGARGDTRFDAALSAWEKYIASSGRTAIFEGPAGGTVRVTGFIFDADAIAPDHGGRRRLKAFIDDTRDYHQWYVARLKSNLVILGGLPPKFAVLGRNVQKRPNGWTARLRLKLEMEMAETGYRPQP